MRSISSTKTVRQIIQFVMGFIILLAVFIFAALVGNKVFGVPQVPVLMEVPYSLSSEQIMAIENSIALPSETSIDDGEITLSVPFKKLGAVSWLMLSSIYVIIGFLLYGLYLVRAILLSSELGETFTLLNAKRLKYLGHLSIAFVIFNIVVNKTAMALSQKIIDEKVTDTVTSIDLSIDFQFIIIGLLLYVLARIWKEGVDMKEELELTI